MFVLNNLPICSSSLYLFGGSHYFREKEAFLRELGDLELRFIYRRHCVFLRNVSKRDCWSFPETKRLLTLLQRWLALNTPPGEDHQRVGLHSGAFLKLPLIAFALSYIHERAFIKNRRAMWHFQVLLSQPASVAIVLRNQETGKMQSGFSLCVERCQQD